ncbi:hypothetical protein CC78DRAFT_569490 [Lojkania enalia]|uniref:Uncharacterized protein n=1 Tax=Lojkania enalia TaxID=147567 RepID=A0A9P4N551_9PLEO|nr:hypothetical protein CC78DRAFT_569490 [Didymosphaeria enalia]
MPSSAGQKVTTDPRSKQELPEAVGVVTSDSLAAESLKGPGSFGEGNLHAAASKQPSDSTTTNTTDTSSATKLPAAPDAEAREAQQGWSETSQLNAGKGLGKETGVGPTYATTGASMGSTGSGFNSMGSTGSASIGPGQGVTAPTGSYAGSAELARDPGEFKPKGKNITEGGFDSSNPNASFNNDIGGKNDPGRVAEHQFQKEAAQSAYDAAGGPRQTGSQVSGETNSQYGILNTDESA